MKTREMDRLEKWFVNKFTTLQQNIIILTIGSGIGFSIAYLIAKACNLL